MHDWARGKKDSKNRKGALKDHLPGAVAGRTPNGKGNGTRKDKDGNPQVCFAWRNNGVCSYKDVGACMYTHPKDVKGKGKPDKGGSKSGNTKDPIPLHRGMEKAKLAAAKAKLRHEGRPSPT